MSLVIRDILLHFYLHVILRFTYLSLVTARGERPSGHAVGGSRLRCARARLPTPCRVVLTYILLSPLTADKTQKGSLSRVAPAAALGWARSRQRAVPQFYLVFQMRWMKALSHRSGGGRAAMAILIQPRVIELNHHDQYSAGSVRTPS